MDKDLAEDLCFVCKDGGELRVCDFKKCLKAYHPQCVNQDADFLEGEDPWTCGWHVCSCEKPSIYQCFCCPTSFCDSCIISSEFVQVKKKTKGFCNNCLKLAKLIEENNNIDSDGEEADFDDPNTYEGLFKDYWDIVKKDEKLTVADIKNADELLKGGENFQNGSDSDKPFEESDGLEDEYDDGKAHLKGSRGKQSGTGHQQKRSRKERTFIGWASQELRDFLTTIGKFTREPQNGHDVTEIIKEYVQTKNLFPPDKKKKKIVIPDETLRMLFRKRKLKFHKIYDLVKNHLAEEHSDFEQESPLGSEEDEVADSCKRQRINSGYKVNVSATRDDRQKILERRKSCYASIVVENIRLLYMTRTLIMELLKNPETFEAKVVGCFVKVKNDQKDVYYLARKQYQLGLVTGIKKSQQEYKIGDTSSDVLLAVTDFSKDIQISSLSHDDITEEDCKDLYELMKKGRCKQPTVADLEAKIKGVHQDIMNHSIEKEIVKLRKLIERANEKGWRRELNEYIDRLELLRNPKERERLVKEIPEVIADTSSVIQPTASETMNIQAEVVAIGVPAANGKDNGSESITVVSVDEASCSNKVGVRTQDGFGSIQLVGANYAASGGDIEITMQDVMDPNNCPTSLLLNEGHEDLREIIDLDDDESETPNAPRTA